VTPNVDFKIVDVEEYYDILQRQLSRNENVQDRAALLTTIGSIGCKLSTLAIATDLE